MPNSSKAKDFRFWKVWRKSGAVAGWTPESNAIMEEIEFHLGILRRGTCSVDVTENIRTNLAKINLTLPDIGVSEKELEALRALNSRKNAEKLLGYLRGGNVSAPRALFGYLLGHLKKTDLSLEDIGSSNEEINVLCRECEKAEAKKNINRLRAMQIGSPDDSIQSLKRGLERENLTLADIGATEEELEGLVKEWYKNEAIKMLMKLRIADHNIGRLSGLKYCLDRCQLTLADIGSSEEEIERIAKSYYKSQAIFWLECLRIYRTEKFNPNRICLNILGNAKYSDFLQKLKEVLLESNLTLSDIGTDKEEVQSFEGFEWV